MHLTHDLRSMCQYANSFIKIPSKFTAKNTSHGYQNILYFMIIFFCYYKQFLWTFLNMFSRSHEQEFLFIINLIVTLIYEVVIYLCAPIYISINSVWNLWKSVFSPTFGIMNVLIFANLMELRLYLLLILI